MYTYNVCLRLDVSNWRGSFYPEGTLLASVGATNLAGQVQASSSSLGGKLMGGRSISTCKYVHTHRHTYIYIYIIYIHGSKSTSTYEGIYACTDTRPKRGPAAFSVSGCVCLTRNSRAGPPGSARLGIILIGVSIWRPGVCHRPGFGGALEMGLDQFLFLSQR